MKKFIISIISLVLFFSNISLIYKVNADETKVKNYKFERDITIDGVIGSNSTFFEVNKNWDIEEVLLHLNFSKSQILNGDVSSLTVLINNVPIKSIKLNAKTNYKNTLEVLVPKDYIFGSAMNNEGYALVGCMVSPGFEFRDFELFKRSFLLEKYPQYEEIILKLTHNE